MTLPEIEAFLAVVDAGTITAAAEKLFIGQSTLSGRLNALEGELNARLFTRGKGIRSAELTDAGRRFLPVAEQWKKLWRETEALRNGERNEKALRTSAVHSVNLYILPGVYRQFAAQHPEVRLWLRIRHSLDSYELVESGDVEAALITKPRFSRKVQTTPLWKEEMTFVCGHGSAYKNTVRPSELDMDREVLLDWSEDFLSWHDYWFGEQRVPRVYTDDMGLLQQFLHDTGSWAVVPLSVANGMCRDREMRICRIVNGPPDRIVYILTRDMTPRTKELDDFLRILRTDVSAQGARWLSE